MLGQRPFAKSGATQHKNLKCRNGKELDLLTFLEDFQVLPQNVTHKGWGTRQERLLPHLADVTTFHEKLMKGDTLQRKLAHGPADPKVDMLFGPFTGI